MLRARESKTLEIAMQRDYSWTLLDACGVTEGMLKGTDETTLPHDEWGIRHGTNYRLEPDRLAKLPQPIKAQLQLDGFDLKRVITVARLPAPIVDALRFTQ
jgi:hypothetical protein